MKGWLGLEPHFVEILRPRLLNPVPGQVLLLMGHFCPGHNRLMNKMEKETKSRSFQPWGLGKFRSQELGSASLDF